MENTSLVVTSIATENHPILKRFAAESAENGVSFIVVGDTKSPKQFNLEGCQFFSIERQERLNFSLAKILPTKHYARKNLGYLIAIESGAEVIIESDDDNVPLSEFWNVRTRKMNASLQMRQGWVNVYKYFSEKHIWPRGFALEHLRDELPGLTMSAEVNCPIQQGLADDNPDVDAIYRLTLPLPVVFHKRGSVALGEGSICPFNSQNTSWFKEAFALLYLPSYCSFRMTDIWRSFIAQRIAWTCGWPIVFHSSTVRQERNDHNLMHDFQDEISGYMNNRELFRALEKLELANGIESIHSNLIACYRQLVDMDLIDEKELALVNAWINDISALD